MTRPGAAAKLDPDLGREMDSGHCRVEHRQLAAAATTTTRTEAGMEASDGGFRVGEQATELVY